MKIIKLIFISFLSFLIISCASYDFSRRVVQQGNLLPASKISKLHVGMSKEDTAIVLGTSLLSPTFNNNRWDYAYTFKEAGNAIVVKNVSVYFSGNRISAIEHHP